MRAYGCLVPVDMGPGLIISKKLLQQMADDIKRTGLFGGCAAGEPLVTDTGLFGWIDVPSADPPQQEGPEYEAEHRTEKRGP